MNEMPTQGRSPFMVSKIVTKLKLGLLIQCAAKLIYRHGVVVKESIAVQHLLQGVKQGERVANAQKT